jgi:hypothetical protein
VIESKLGQLVGDIDGAIAGLRRHFVAEAEAVVEYAHPQVEFARVGPAGFGLAGRFEVHEQLVVMIAHEAAFTPRLLPGFVVTRARSVRDPEAVIEGGLRFEAHAKEASRHDVGTHVAHRIKRGAAGIDIDVDTDAAVR